jgi:hypothetical protein
MEWAQLHPLHKTLIQIEILKNLFLPEGRWQVMRRASWFPVNRVAIGDWLKSSRAYLASRHHLASISIIVTD